MNKKYILITIFIISLIYIILIGLNINENQVNKESNFYDGKICFVNGVICKEITCGLPGGCKATNCIGGLEYQGALQIKCILLNKSKGG